MVGWQTNNLLIGPQNVPINKLFATKSLIIRKSVW